MNDDFLDYLLGQGLAQSTAATYDRVARRIEAFIEDAESDDPRTVAESFLLASIDHTTPTGTRSHLTGAVVNWLRWQGVDTTHWSMPRLNPRRRVQQAAPEALNASELQAYLEVVDEHVEEPCRTILLLLPRCGLRVSEICSLTVDDITKKANKLGLRLVGKGNKVRWVPLGKAARTTLKQYLTGWRKGQNTATSEAWLFPGRSGYCSPQTVRAHLRKVRPYLHGTGRHVHPHMLRHTFATRTLEDTDADIADVKALLGHASITTTQRYVHPSADHLADLIEDL